MPTDIEFFFDFGSPTAYLAWTQLDRIAAETGAKVIHRPFLLGGVFKETGNRSPIMVPTKGKHMMVDLRRWATHWDVTLEVNPFFPINTLSMMRSACALEGTEEFPAFQAAIMRAMWNDRKNMNKPEIVAEVLDSAGLDGEAIVAAGTMNRAKQRLKDVTEEAVKRGAFGAPTFFVGTEMFFGQDRLDFVAAAARQ
ncbi:MAG: 2-hydroxychromene-2-carboxylate isomerase [Pseudomonadota bacterium]